MRIKKENRIKEIEALLEKDISENEWVELMKELTILYRDSYLSEHHKKLLDMGYKLSERDMNLRYFKEVVPGNHIAVNIDFSKKQMHIGIVYTTEIENPLDIGIWINIPKKIKDFVNIMDSIDNFIIKSISSEKL